MNAKESKCWTCKFGICVREKVEEKLYHTGMKGMPGQEETNPFEQQMSFGEEPESDLPEGMLEHTVEQEHLKGICFWRPEGITHPTSPIVVANVQECNRYSKL